MLSLWLDTSPSELEDMIPKGIREPVATEVLAVCRVIEQMFTASVHENTLDPGLDPAMLGVLFEKGVFSLTVPRENGGLGVSLRDFVVTMEHIASLGPTWAMTAVPHLCISVKAVAQYCIPEARDKILRNIVARSQLLAFAITEDQGSDVAAMRTRLRRSDTGKLLLTGHKQWITNLARASHVVVAALCPDQHDAPGASLLVLVPLPQPGVTISRAWEKTSVNGSDTAEIFFDHVEILSENVLCKPGQGMNVFLEMVQPGRLGTAAAAIGLARASLHVANTESPPLLSTKQAQKLEAMLDASSAAIRLCAVYGEEKHVDFSHIVSLVKYVCGELSQSVLQEIDHAYAVDGRTAPPVVARARDALGLFRLLKGPGEILALQTVLSWSAAVRGIPEKMHNWPTQLNDAADCLMEKLMQLREQASPANNPVDAIHIANGLARWWLLLSTHFLTSDGAHTLTPQGLKAAQLWAQDEFTAWSLLPVVVGNRIAAYHIDALYDKTIRNLDHLFRLTPETVR